MPSRRIDPREQFSKKLAKWTAIFWFFYMVFVAVMCIIEPSVSDSALYLGICSSLIMLLNVWAYTHNSVYEKAILAGLEKNRLRITWKGSDEKEDKDEEKSDEEVG